MREPASTDAARLPTHDSVARDMWSSSDSISFQSAARRLEESEEESILTASTSAVTSRDCARSLCAEERDDFSSVADDGGVEVTLR